MINQLGVQSLIAGHHQVTQGDYCPGKQEILHDVLLICFINIFTHELDYNLSFN
jgi:hypothetical protein